MDYLLSTNISNNQEYTEEIEKEILKIKNKMADVERKILEKEELTTEEYSILKIKLNELESIKNYAMNEKADKEQAEKIQELCNSMTELIITGGKK